MDFVARPLEVVEHCCGLAQEQEQQAEASGSSVPARVAEAFRGTRTHSNQSMPACHPHLTSNSSTQSPFPTTTARLREQGPAALAGVPLLDPRTWALDKAAGKLKPNTLVRFRGMVQDMLDPQFFVGMQKHAGSGRLRCSLYSDGFTGGEDGEEGGWEAHTTMERRPLILTPIPGEAEWVVEGLLREAAGGQQPPNGSGASSSGNKRGLGEAEEMEVEVEWEAGAAASRGVKAPRTGETDAMAVVEGGNGGAAAAAAAAADPEKKGAEGPLRCLSYLYGEKEEEGEGGGEQSAASAAATPRLNEALDVLAVLSYTVPGAMPQQQQVQGQGEGAGAGNGGMGEQDEEEAAMEQLMLSLEPRLHIVLWAKAAPLPLASFHDPALFLGSAVAVDANAHADLEPTKARAALLAHLAASLGGDELAAEYLLLALLARVCLRSPGSGDVVGPLPVNLSRAPQGLGPRLAALLGALCPRSRLLPVDLATLDDPRAFIPRKDPAKLNVLEATPLQVAPGTALVLDETGLDSGRLGPEGACACAFMNEVKCSVCRPSFVGAHKMMDTNPTKQPKTQAWPTCGA